MLGLSATTRIYLACGATDMRKAYDGLSAIVSDRLAKDPCSGQWFVFCNRQRNRLKLIFWDGTGLCLFAKRLERGTFDWPCLDAVSLTYSPAELTMLLGGIDVSSAKRRKWYAQKPLHEREVKRA